MSQRRPITVHPIPGEPLRYHVSSRTRPITYLVDLEEQKGNGECGCPHFDFHLRRLLQDGAPISSLTRCDHIKAARDWLADQVIKLVAEQANKPAQRRSA